MKKKTLLKSIWILLVMCGVSANAGAQDFFHYRHMDILRS